MLLRFPAVKRRAPRVQERSDEPNIFDAQTRRRVKLRQRSGCKPPLFVRLYCTEGEDSALELALFLQTVPRGLHSSSSARPEQT
jgi:hypothetical protein